MAEQGFGTSNRIDIGNDQPTVTPSCLFFYFFGILTPQEPTSCLIGRAWVLVARDGVSVRAFFLSQCCGTRQFQVADYIGEMLGLGIWEFEIEPRWHVVSRECESPPKTSMTIKLNAQTKIIFTLRTVRPYGPSTGTGQVMHSRLYLLTFFFFFTRRMYVRTHWNFLRWQKSKSGTKDVISIQRRKVTFYWKFSLAGSEDTYLCMYGGAVHTPF
jgi:hypothetical protein